MVPHVLLGVQSLGTELALESIIRHLVGFDHVGLQLSLKNIL